MAKNKTVVTETCVETFIASLDDTRKREQSKQLLSLFQNITKVQPKMWGTSIIGFGQYHYKYESGREGDMPLTGFSPRAQNFSLYVMPGFTAFDELLSKLGKHKTGKSCLYIKSLEDIDQEVLTMIITGALKEMLKRYPDAHIE